MIANMLSTIMIHMYANWVASFLWWILIIYYKFQWGGGGIFTINFRGGVGGLLNCTWQVLLLKFFSLQTNTVCLFVLVVKKKCHACIWLELMKLCSSGAMPGLTNKTWQVFHLSPLYKFSTQPQSLKQYERSLATYLVQVRVMYKVVSVVQR